VGHLLLFVVGLDHGAACRRADGDEATLDSHLPKALEVAVDGVQIRVVARKRQHILPLPHEILLVVAVVEDLNRHTVAVLHSRF